MVQILIFLVCAIVSVPALVLAGVSIINHWDRKRRDYQIWLWECSYKIKIKEKEEGIDIL